jgi:uncharacterized SAM-binding protein YcdF (DUF218 family)
LAGGFLWFVIQSGQSAGPLPAHADGIVALTGGPGRVETALHLLVDGKADRLLITGIGGGADLATFGHLAGIDVDALASRITLGRYAASTRGNGVETAAWAARHRIASLIVVTAGYHMPRALIELRAALPNVRLYPLPVQTAERPVGAPKPGFKLEAEEYAKFLFTLSGLSEWLPRRESSADVPSRTAVRG